MKLQSCSKIIIEIRAACPPLHQKVMVMRKTTIFSHLLNWRFRRHPCLRRGIPTVPLSLSLLPSPLCSILSSSSSSSILIPLFVTEHNMTEPAAAADWNIPRRGRHAVGCSRARPEFCLIDWELTLTGEISRLHKYRARLKSGPQDA